MNKVQVSCRQTAPVVGDARGNRLRIAREARAAAAAGAQIVVFPELAASGYSFASKEELRAHAEGKDGSLLREWQGLAAELGIVLVVGYAELDDTGLVYNSAAIIDGSGVLAHYRKAHLWDRVRLIFAAGSDQPPVVDTKFGRLGLLICYDLEFPEWVRTVALQGAELLCAPVNWPLYPSPEGERPGERFRVQANASVNRMAIAACDRSGNDRNQQWLGGSLIVDADGYPLASTELGRVGTCCAELDLSASRNKKVSAYSNVHDDRRPHLYTDITKEP